MNLNNAYSLKHDKNCHLLYDPELLEASLLNSTDAGLLNHDIFQLADTYELISTGGRGQAWFLEIAGLSAVLRAYQRGGLVSKLNRQTYIGGSPEKSRAFREWRLLQWMFAEGLPVPRPIAASYCRWPVSFSPLYRAHILVQKIPNTQTLDQILSQQDLDSTIWQSIGHTIYRFHKAAVYHADLNANNILLDNKQAVFLIDFDKSKIVDTSGSNVSRQKDSQAITDHITSKWKQENLARLERSLIKQQGLHANYHFSEQNWQDLIVGYKSEVTD